MEVNISDLTKNIIKQIELLSDQLHPSEQVRVDECILILEKYLDHK